LGGNLYFVSLLPFSFEQLTFYRHIGLLTGALQVLIQFKTSGEMEEVWFESTSSPFPHTLPWMRTVVVLNSREEFKVGVDVLNEGLCVFEGEGVLLFELEEQKVVLHFILKG